VLRSILDRSRYYSYCRPEFLRLPHNYVDYDWTWSVFYSGLFTIFAHFAEGDDLIHYVRKNSSKITTTDVALSLVRSSKQGSHLGFHKLDDIRGPRDHGDENDRQGLVTWPPATFQGYSTKFLSRKNTISELWDTKHKKMYMPNLSGQRNMCAGENTLVCLPSRQEPGKSFTGCIATPRLQPSRNGNNNILITSRH
jgi:hypothetical protein